MFLEAQEVARKSNNGTVVNAYYNVEAVKKIFILFTFMVRYNEAILQTQLKNCFMVLC